MSTIRARIDARKKKKKDTTTSFDFLLFSFDYVRFFATEEWGDSVLFLKQYDKRWGGTKFLGGEKDGRRVKLPTKAFASLRWCT